MSDQQPPYGGATPPGPWSSPGGPGYDSGPSYPNPPYAGAPPGGPYPNYPYAGPQRDAPGATASLVLGIIGLAGLAVCGLLLVLSPFAWYYGNRALEEIELSGRTLGGHGNAKAGQVMGIIGTVLLVIGLVGLVVFVILLANAPSD